MADNEAPKVFVTYAHDSPEHKDRVRRFAEFLHGQIGLDVHLDQWDDHDRRDWSSWALDHLDTANFVVVIASPDYKRRAEGKVAHDEGRGSQFEAARIRDRMTDNLGREIKRILPVVFPQQSVEDIPNFLNPYSTTRYPVETFTEEGVADLLTAITGRARHQRPERGEWRGGAAGGYQPRRTPVTRLDWQACSSLLRAEGARIGGVHYADSIVLKAPERLGFVEVDLGMAYRRLTAVVGVLDDADETFQVGHFRFLLDGKPSPETKVGMGKPARIEVDVSGVLKLRLEMYRPGTTDHRWWPELAWADPTLE
ncbi:SEFIR domain-containing protein [Amycolatopsis pittospori]|uniref:SEFIR domain-containing protein n=1 Tax=Amycolatopsis pittospori TaxID=2749434 RepID=UPI0015F04646|nr:SEFIR domain-containing protein [Amycolatopsis pittospori]